MAIEQATITRPAVVKLIAEEIADMCFEETGLTKDNVADATELFMEGLAGPDSSFLRRMVTDFMEDFNIGDIEDLQKRQGRWKREDWCHVGDGLCTICKVHLLGEDYSGEFAPEICPKCGGVVEVIQEQ